MTSILSSSSSSSSSSRRTVCKGMEGGFQGKELGRRGFPPAMPRMEYTFVKGGGRMVMRESEGGPKPYLHLHRHNGRLQMHLVEPGRSPTTPPPRLQKDMMMIGLEEESPSKSCLFAQLVVLEKEEEEERATTMMKVEEEEEEEKRGMAMVKIIMKEEEEEEEEREMTMMKMIKKKDEERGTTTMITKKESQEEEEEEITLTPIATTLPLLSWKGRGRGRVVVPRELWIHSHTLLYKSYIQMRPVLS